MMAPVIRRSTAASSTTRTVISLSPAASACGAGAVVMAITSSGGQIALNPGDGKLHALDLLLHKPEGFLNAVEFSLSTHVLKTPGRLVGIGRNQVAERSLEGVGRCLNPMGVL